MKSDPGIAPVREVRAAVSRSVGHDPVRLVDYYLALQERFADRLVHAPAKAAPAGPGGGAPPPAGRKPR